MGISLQTSSLSTSNMSKIGYKIFMNETGGKKVNLFFWNPKKNFASMGIGHFVWVPSKGKITLLADSFSKFLDFCKEKGIILPSWLQKNQKCPWKDHSDFVKSEKQESWQRRKVRAFLNFYKRVQAEFILVNFLKNLPAIIEKLPEHIRVQGIEYCNLLLKTPEGCFALIDYNHFKGQGLEANPEYNNQAWGLKQVIERALSKKWREEPLDIFIHAARDTLTNRVKNAPDAKKEIEKSFLAGWYNRLDRYKTD